MSEFVQNVTFPYASGATARIFCPGSFESATAFTNSANVGTFIIGETVTGAGKIGIVRSAVGVGAALVMVVKPVLGLFATGNAITGSTSGATATVGTVTSVTSLGGGLMRTISITNPTAQSLVVTAYDARNADGTPWQSLGRRRYELDLTVFDGVRGATPLRFETYGTALAGGPALATHHQLWKTTVVTLQNQTFDNMELRADYGMVIAVTSVATAVDAFIGVEYRSRVFGRWRTHMADDAHHLAHS